MLLGSHGLFVILVFGDFWYFWVLNKLLVLLGAWRLFGPQGFLGQGLLGPQTHFRSLGTFGIWVPGDILGLLGPCGLFGPQELLGLLGLRGLLGS